MQKITPFLWYNGNAEEAMNFYVSIFKNAKAGNIMRAGGEGSAITSVTFQIEGLEFFALNGGPQFTFTPAISFFVNCNGQEEVDELWEKLSEGGQKQQCGWLTDKFGMSWQIIPSALRELMYDKNPAKSKNVLNAMLQMTKIDIAGLKRAYEEA